MKVLILAGQFNRLSAAKIYPFSENFSLLEWQIQQIQKITRDIVVVLDNEEADEALRVTPQLMNYELAFDTHGEQSNFFTNLKTGLYITNKYCLVLPLSTPLIDGQILYDLVNHYHKYGSAGQVELIQSYFPVHGKMRRTFPLLVTAYGKQKVLSLENFDKNAFESLSLSPFPLLFEPHQEIVKGL